MAKPIQAEEYISKPMLNGATKYLSMAAAESEKAREITIIELDYGYKVNVGCQEFAFSSKKELLGKLVDYLENPAEVEKKYREGKLLKKK